MRRYERRRLHLHAGQQRATDKVPSSIYFRISQAVLRAIFFLRTMAILRNASVVRHVGPFSLP
jgi:hypothetical protein